METREGGKHYIYRHSAGDDVRFRENTITFPDGSTGKGLFAERGFEKHEYISTWLGEPLDILSTRVTADLESARTRAAANTGAGTINDARNRGDATQINAELTGRGEIRALADIPKGTEICIPYGTEFWHNRGGTEEGEGRGEALEASWTQTVRDDAIELSSRIRRRKDGTGRVRIAYKYSEKGRDLYEAGHIAGSREYAVGADPFRWPEELRTRVMAERGAEGDDASAFPRARRAMVPEDSSICDDMLEWKETISREGRSLPISRSRQE